MTTRIVTGDCRVALASLPAESVHFCVTSPPYYGLRDYGSEPQVWGGAPGCEHAWAPEQKSAQRSRNGEGSTLNCPTPIMLHPSQGAFCRHCSAERCSLGLEPTPALYIEHMVAVFREVRRVLRRDGTLWLNIGDCYAGSWGNQGRKEERGTQRAINGEMLTLVHDGRYPDAGSNTGKIRTAGLKPKDLLGIPWMLAFALRDDGWYLRSEITWAKRAPMPESVTDRPTSATEKVFLLTKSARYFYDAEAVKEDSEPFSVEHGKKYGGMPSISPKGNPNRNDNGGRGTHCGVAPGRPTRNMRNWWLFGPEPFPEAHFATFPTEIPRRAILAGTSARGVCPKCAAPWARVVERKAMIIRRSKRTHSMGQTRSSGTVLEPNEAITIGWQPTCGCLPPDEETPIPATVLDPFLGAGTTAMVADQLGRDCIGIELNASYAEMARCRIEHDAGMFARVAAE